MLKRILSASLSLLLVLFGSEATAKERRHRIRRLPASIVNSLVLDEQQQVAQACYWLRSGDVTWDPRDSMIQLSRAGLTQLARDAYDPAMTLIAAAHRAAAEYSGEATKAKEKILQDCGPDQLVAPLTQLGRGLGTTDLEKTTLEACGNAISALADSAEADSTEPLEKLGHALRETLHEGETIASLLTSPRRLARAFDFSPRLVELMVRLTQAAHEKIDGSAINRLPFGSGAAKWLIELLIGELLGIVMDYQLFLLEEREIVSRADVARRSCLLLEEAAPRPVITNRMLIRTILRFVTVPALESPPSQQTSVRERRRTRRRSRASRPTFHARTVCQTYPGFCRRMARRLGVRDPENNRPLGADQIQRGLEPSFGYVDLAPLPPGIEEDKDPRLIITRGETNGTSLLQATGSCATQESCTLAEINRAMSMLAVASVPVAEVTDIVPEIEVDDVECCCESEDAVRKLVPLHPAEPGVIGVLLDRSSSMSVGSPTKWERLEDAVEALITEVTSPGMASAPELRLGVFPEPGTRCNAGSLHSRGSGSDALGWLARVPPPKQSGYDLTPIAAMVDHAAASIEHETDPALILVTDGSGNCDGGDRGRILREIGDARNKGVPVYVIGIGLRSHQWQHRKWIEMAKAGGTEAHISTISMAADPLRVATAIDAAMLARRCRVQTPEAPSVVVIDGKEYRNTWTYTPTPDGGELQLDPLPCAEFLRPGSTSLIGY